MRRRHAEIAGAGFAGLTAACALAQRGWSVRVHERGDELRTAGSGIYIYENGLRVLEALGAYDAAVQGASRMHTREVRDDENRVLSEHSWGGARVFSIVRQNIIRSLVAVAERAAAEIVTGSTAVAATPDGELVLADGRRLKADLVIAADGTNSRVRDALGLLARRKLLADGATRLLIDRSPEELRSLDGGKSIEYWSGKRRLVYTPCGERELYLALVMLDCDEAAKQVPVHGAEWTRSFPYLAPLLGRLGDQGRYDRFELLKLKRWSAGRVAIVGDAAHAMPPNIGQGGGCAMMNALALAYYLDRYDEVPAALAAWERSERPLTEHTQRISYVLGLPAAWPPTLRAFALKLAGRWQWLVKQRTRTARHIPTGT